MERKVLRRCYDIGVDKTEYMVFPDNCPIERKYCFGGRVWIGENKPEFTIEDICKYYMKDTFNDFENKIGCNYDGRVSK